MGFLDRASTWLFEQQRTSDGVDITYRRGAASVSITAVIGQTEFASEIDEQSQATWVARDYLIASADLIIEGLQTLPQTGDTIEEEIGGKAITYEVLSMTSGQCYSFQDVQETELRVHTKKIGAEL